MSQTAILSFYLSNYIELAKITNPIREEYCNRHGYQFIEKIGPYANPDWYYAFDRLKYLYDLLFLNIDGYDLKVVHVQNLHTCIMNLQTRIEDFLEDGKDFYITKDCHDINAGSFIIRKSEWSEKWLKHLLSFEKEHKNHCWFEQKLIMDNWTKDEFAERIKVLPQNTINAYFYDLYGRSGEEGEFVSGKSFLLHAPGTSLEDRIKLFSGDRVQKQIIR